MKRILFFIQLILFAFLAKAQLISNFAVTITDSSGVPISYNYAKLFNGVKEIGNSYSDENGIFAFLIIDSLELNIDSVFISIVIRENSIINIHLKGIELFSNNKISNYIITMTYYKLFFSLEEYDKYLKENNFLPRRKNFGRR